MSTESMPSAVAQYTWQNAGDLRFLGWPALTGLGASAVVSTREAGNLGLHVGDDPAAVLANRATMAAALGHDLQDFVFAAQAHGPHVTVVGEQDRGRGATSPDQAVAQTDALVTATPGLVLAVLVADCVPIVLVEPENRLLAAVHAGWRGTVTGVTSAAVEQIRRLGGDPANIVACIGPAIHPDRYQVGEDVLDAATVAFGSESPAVISPDGTGRWRFDLWQANTRLLRREGVPAGQIHVADLDTGPSTPFYSHRGETPSGRFGLFAWLEPR